MRAAASLCMSFFDRYMRWVLLRPWVVVVSACAVAVVFAAGLQRLYFEDDYEVFFDGENPYLQAHHQVERTFARVDWYTFLIEHADGDAFSRQSLEEIEWLTEQAWTLPFTVGVESLANYQYAHADADDLVIDDLFTGAGEMSDDEVARRKAFALSEPAIPGRAVSYDGRVSTVASRIVFPLVDPAENTYVARAGESLAGDFAARYPDSRLYLSGSVVINQGFLDGAQADFSMLVPLMYLIVLVAAGLILRSFWATVCILVLVFVTVVSAMGFASWLSLPLTIVSVSVPTLIMTVAVAAGVHLLSGVLRRLREGRPKSGAIREAFRSNLIPVGLTSLTTAIGLLALLISDVPPYRYIGITSAAGAVLTFLFTYSLLPAMLVLLPLRARQRPAAPSRFWDRLADFVIARRWVLLGGLTAIAAFFLVFLPRNELNDGFVTYFDKNMPARIGSEFWRDNLDGYYYVNFAFQAPEEGGAHDPDYLRAVASFVNWAQAQPNINHVMTLNHTYRRLNQVMNGDDPAFYRLPESRDLAAQYLLLYQMSLPRGVDLTDQIDTSQTVTLVGVPISDATNRDVRAFVAASTAWIEENLPPSMHTVGTGSTVLFAHIWQASAISNITGGLVAALLIALVLMVALGSLRIGLISLVPNLLPAAIAFGVWGLFSGRIDIASSSVVIVSLGIVVDDTIHFLTRYRRAMSQPGTMPEEAVRYAFRTVGPALLTTTIVLIAGFLVLTQSQITLNSTMGLLSALIVGLALILDFFLLPPVLIAIDRLRQRFRKPPA